MQLMSSQPAGIDRMPVTMLLNLMLAAALAAPQSSWPLLGLQCSAVCAHLQQEGRFRAPVQMEPGSVQLWEALSCAVMASHGLAPCGWQALPAATCDKHGRASQPCSSAGLHGRRQQAQHQHQQQQQRKCPWPP